VKLIVGLGNPGKEYSGSLHNVGFMSVNFFARRNHMSFDKKQANARTGSGKVDGVQVLLARPQTYMNRSGLAVSRLVRKFKINLADLLVVYDDLDLPLGKIRIREGGSAGGHNGMKSIIAELGSQDFPRLRVGIGRPRDTHENVIPYLLGESDPETKKAINGVLPIVSEAILSFINGGVMAAMNKYNQKS